MTSRTTNSARIAEHFSKAAADYHHHHQIQQYFGQQLLEPLLNQPRQRIVDIGCGPASMHSSLMALGKHYLGIDVAAAMLHQARQRTGQQNLFIQADAQALPLQSNSVDLCFANLSLQWCADLTQAVAEFKRVLRHQGQGAFNLPIEGSFSELKWSWQQLDQTPHTQQFKPLEEILRAIAKTGLIDVQHRVIEHQQWFSDLPSLLRSIKGVGANFVDRADSPGLMTPRRFEQLSQHYDRFRTSKGVPLTWRVAAFYIKH